MPAPNHPHPHLARLTVGDGFKANAFAKVQKVLAGWPTKITSSKDLKGVAGVGKGSAAKASRGCFCRDLG